MRREPAANSKAALQSLLGAGASARGTDNFVRSLASAGKVARGRHLPRRKPKDGSNVSALARTPGFATTFAQSRRKDSLRSIALTAIDRIAATSYFWGLLGAFGGTIIPCWSIIISIIICIMSIRLLIICMCILELGGPPF